MVNCMVKSCTNSGSIPGVSYHQIPKYDRKRWLEALKQSPTKYRGNRNAICSRHFKVDDFKRDGKIIVLKRGVVPSLFLNDPEETAADESVACGSNRIQHSNKAEVQTLSFDIVEEQTLSSTSDNTSKSSTSPQKSDALAPLKRKRTTNSPGTTSNSIGLKGSPKKNRRIVRSLHSYCLSPRKEDNKKLHLMENMKKKIKTLEQKSRRLKKRVKDLKFVLQDLKKK